MLYYFGSKGKLVKYYPKPKYGRIIEPFAGAAKYALAYPDNEVTLIEPYKVLTDIWEWLIQATIEDVDSLPTLTKGQRVVDCLQLSQVERDLLGFLVTKGVTRPHNVVTGRSDPASYPEGHPFRRPGNTMDLFKAKAKNILPRIRHWKVYNRSYTQYKINQKATWFIDPPYQRAGHNYVHSQIDYGHLSRWCRERNGLSIVCEEQGADWLDFTPLNSKKITNPYGKTCECVWINDRQVLSSAISRL